VTGIFVAGRLDLVWLALPIKRQEERKMGNETRWAHWSVSFDTPTLQKGGLHLAHTGIYIEEELGCRAALWDRQCGQMY
jgi:hypothetical protein